MPPKNNTSGTNVAAKPVTDPGLLSQLNSGGGSVAAKPVSDPDLITKLNSADTPASDPENIPGTDANGNPVSLNPHNKPLQTTQGVPHETAVFNLSSANSAINDYLTQLNAESAEAAKDNTVTMIGRTEKGGIVKHEWGVHPDTGVTFKEQRVNDGNEIDNSPIAGPMVSVPKDNKGLNNMSLDDARNTIKLETDAAGNYLQKFFQDNEKALSGHFLTPAARPGENAGPLPTIEQAAQTAQPMQTMGTSGSVVDQSYVINRVLGDNADTKAAADFFSAGKDVLQQKYDQQKLDIESRYPVKYVTDVNEEGSHTTSYRVDEAGYNKELAAANQDFQQKQTEFDQAAFNIASKKAVNAQVEKHGGIAKLDPTEVGLEMMDMLDGNDENTAQTKRYYQKNLLKPAEKAALQLKGYEAMQSYMFSALGHGMDANAKDMSQHVTNYQQKVLDSNPEFKKQQMVRVISNKNYELGDTGNTLADYLMPTNPMVAKEQNSKKLLAAATAAGFTKEDLDKNNISYDDLQKSKGFLSETAGSFFNHSGVAMTKELGRFLGQAAGEDPDAVNRHFDDDWYSKQWTNSLVGQKPEATALFQNQSMVNSDPNSKNFLMETANPNAGKFNPTTTGIFNQISDGMGQIAALAAETEMLGEPLLAGRLGLMSKIAGASIKDTKLMLGTEKVAAMAHRADQAGLVLGTFATQYDDNYSDALGMIGDNPEDEGKRRMIAFLKTMSSAATEMILPDKEIAQSVLSPGSKTGREFIDYIQKTGLQDLSQKQLSKYIGAGIKEGFQMWGKEVSEDVLDQAFGGDIVSMIYTPEKFKQTDVSEEYKQTITMSAISSAIPTLTGGFRQGMSLGPMKNRMLYEVGSNPMFYQKDIEQQVTDGKLSREQADDKISTVKALANIVQNSVPDVSLINKKKLTDDQKALYANSLLQEQILEEHKKTVKDKVQEAQIDKEIGWLQKARTHALENAGTEGTPQNIVSPNTDQNGKGNQKATQTKDGGQENGRQNVLTQNEQAGAGGPGNAANATNSIGEYDFETEPDDAHPETEPVASPSASETAVPDEIKVGDMLDKPGSYKGQKGRFFQDGQAVVFKVDGENKEFELGNVDQVKDAPISEFDIKHEASVVNAPGGNAYEVRGEKYNNNFSDPVQAINRDADGNVLSVNLETADGKKRTFRGNIAEDLAYQIHLQQITKDDGSRQQFEQHLNTEPGLADQVNAGRFSEAAPGGAVENNGPVRKQKLERKQPATKPTVNTEAQQPAIESFKTSKGSEYTVHEDGTTTRNKSVHNETGHEGDEGMKPKSSSTVYVSKEALRHLDVVQATAANKKERFTIAHLPDGKIGVGILTTDGSGNHGKVYPNTTVEAKTQPEVGLYPVETWEGHLQPHFGNEITEVTPKAIKNESAKIQADKSANNAVHTGSTPAAATQKTNTGGSANEAASGGIQEQANVQADWANRPLSEPEVKESEKVAPEVRERYKSAPKIVGHEFTRSMPNGQSIKGRFVLTDANAVTPSHNAQTFGTSEGFPLLENGSNPNDRDYTLTKNRNAVLLRAQQYDGRAVNDVPTIDRNGIVVDGNDRTMSGQIAAQNNTDAAYIQALKDNSAIYGFNAKQVDDMIDEGKHPRLFFESERVMPYNTDTFAQFNKDAKKIKSPLETAIELRRTLPENLINNIGEAIENHEEMSDFYRSNADQRRVADLMQQAGILNADNITQYYDKGNFTVSGKELLQNIMMAKVLDENSLRTVQAYPSLVNKIVRAIKNIVAIDAIGDYGYAETVNAAITLYHNVATFMDAGGIKGNWKNGLESYISQKGLFGEETYDASTIATYGDMTHSTQKMLKNVSQEMLNKARNGVNGTDLFGNEPASKLQLIQEAKTAIEEYEKQQRLKQQQFQLNGPDVAKQVTGGPEGPDANVKEPDVNPKKAEEEGQGREPDKQAEPEQVPAELTPASTDRSGEAAPAVEKPEDSKESRKKLSKKIRDLKTKVGGDNTLFASIGPINPTTIKGAIEAVALAVEAGEHIAAAIQRGIDFINQRYFKNWDDSKFKKLFTSMSGLPLSPDQIRDIKNTLNETAVPGLSQKNQLVADKLVEDITTQKKTLGEVKDKIKQSGLPELTQIRINNYIDNAVRERMYREPGAALAQDILTKAGGDFKAAMKELVEHVDTEIMAATSDVERENIRMKEAAAKTWLQTQQTLNGIEDGTIHPVSIFPENNHAFQLPAQTFMQSKIQKNQDRYQRWSQAQAASTVPITDEIDAVSAFRLAKGRAMDLIKNVREWMGDTAVKKDTFFYRLHQAGIDIQKFGLYMYALHATERNAQNAQTRQAAFDQKVSELNEQIATAHTSKKAQLENELDDILKQKNPNYILMPDGGSGMTNEQADGIINESKADGMEAIYQGFVKEFKDNVVDKILDYKYESGLLSDEEYQQIKDGYSNYVPLKIDMEEVLSRQQSAGTLASTGKSGKDLYRSTGASEVSYLERNNPVLQSVYDLEYSIMKGEENRANIKAANLIRANENPSIWSVKQAMYEYQTDKGGKVIGKTEKFSPKNGIPFWEHGNKSYLMLNDKALADTFHKINPTALLRTLQATTGFVRFYQTVASPTFIIVNPLLDVQDALITTLGHENPEVAKNYIKNLKALGVPGLAHFKVVKQLLTGKGEWADMAKRWEKAGAKVSFTKQVGLEEQHKKSLKIFEDYAKSKANPRLVAKTIAHSLENFSGALESATRVIVFKSGLDSGMSDSEAGLLSRDATIDFEKSGIYGAYWNSWKAFANASLQGSTILLKNFAKSSKVRYAAGAMVLFGMSQAFLADMMSDCDIDPKNCYFELPEYIKQKNIVLPGALFGQKNYVTIPMGRHIGWFNYMGQNMYGLIKHLATSDQRAPGAGQFTVGTIGSLIDFFNPAGGNNSITQQMAGNFAPIVGLKENQNSFGGDIHPTATNEPGHFNFYPNTPSAWVAASNGLSEMTGGDATHEGKVEVSPNTLQYIYSSLFGGLGSFVQDAAITSSNIANGQPLKSNEIPLLDRFYKESNMSITRQKASDLLDRSEKNELTEGEMDQFVKYEEDLVKANVITDDQMERAVKSMVQHQRGILKGELKRENAE